MSFTLDILIQSAGPLVAKDLNGKSDPYVVFGLIDKNGKDIGKFDQTQTKYKTLNPTWTNRNKAQYASKLETASAVKFTLWDEDAVGKDEFLGEAIVPLTGFQEAEKLDADNKPLTVTLGPRAGKKDKVTGSLSIKYNYLTKAKSDQLVAEAEAEKARQTAEALKRAEEEKKARAEAVDKLMATIPTREGADLTKLKELADKIIAKGGNKISDRKVLRNVLSEVGLWDLIKRYSLWANELQNGIDNAEVAGVDQATKRDIAADSTVIESMEDRAWMMFDHDGDGSVEPREVLIGIAMLVNCDNAAERGSFFFDIFDTDKSGELDRNEVLRLFESDWKQTYGITLATVQSLVGKQLYGSQKTALARAMTEVRQKIAANTTYPSRMVAALFRRADKDGSGTISKTEFLEFSADNSSRVAVQLEIAAVIKSMSSTLEPDLQSALMKYL